MGRRNVEPGEGDRADGPWAVRSLRMYVRTSLTLKTLESRGI